MSAQFPESFLWGVSTSAYQIEGAWLADGRGLSIWDAFSHTPGKTFRGATGDETCEHYRRFETDIALMKEMGLSAYRFSIAWPRVQPSGRGAVNQRGIDFYSRLIDRLLEHGIEPWPTLHHWDLPLALQTEFDGWLNPSIADRFGEYADLCFERFGDRVNSWLTINEPWCQAVLGHGNGIHAPGRVSDDEPYLAGHHLLLAHAKAVQAFRARFGSDGAHRISIAVNCDWREPASDAPADREAAQRAVEFFVGWFLDPIYRGDYPACMRERLGDRLPHFTDEQRKSLHGSADFIGLNHYTSHIASEGGGSTGVSGNGGFHEDIGVALADDPAWEKTGLNWNVVPDGMRKLLCWLDRRYDRPPIYITENGCALEDGSPGSGVHDPFRVRFLNRYLCAAAQAIGEGVDLRGYFQWSLMDNFEWSFGFSKRFGLVYVDYATQERTPKDSARFYAGVITSRGASLDAEVCG